MGLKGDLGELPLPDLVEMTSVGGKTGRLVLFDEEDAVAGVLMFRGGRLVGAHSGELTRREGLLRAPRAQDRARSTSIRRPNSRTTRSTCRPSLSSSRGCAASTRRTGCAGACRRRPSSATSAARPKTPWRRASSGTSVRARARVGDVVEGMLVGGDVDEYDALHALRRLASREVVRVERPAEAGVTDPLAGRPPQPELER